MPQPEAQQPQSDKPKWTTDDEILATPRPADDPNHYNTDCCGLPCPASTEGVLVVSAGHAESVARAQAFFAQMATESRRSSFGIFEKEFIKALLIRAQEAKLYDPTK